MRNHIFTLQMYLLVLTAFASVTFAQKAKEKDTRNVLDYYNMAVNKDGKATFLKKDLKRGYLDAITDDGLHVVALFRKDDGSPVLLVHTNTGAPLMITGLEAFEVNDMDAKSLTPKTESVLPKLSNRENVEIFNGKINSKYRVTNEHDLNVIYDFPAGNKVIEVKAGKIIDGVIGSGFIKIYELHLKNDKFVVVR